MVPNLAAKVARVEVEAREGEVIMVPHRRLSPLVREKPRALSAPLLVFGVR